MASEVAELERKIDVLAEAVKTLTKFHGARLTRNQMCDRLDIHRNTLAKRMAEPGFPQPGRDGKWLLSEVVEWELLNR